MYFSKKYPYVFIASVATIIAGVLHATVVAKAHISIPPEFIFFVVTGVLQIAWGVNYFYHRTQNMYFAGAVLNLGLTFFWLTARVFPAPFADTPETIQMLGILTAFVQIIAFAASFWSLYRFHKATILSSIMLVVLSAVLAGIGYVTSKNGEGMMLKIWPQIEEVEHGHGAEADPHDDEEEIGPHDD